MFIRSTPIKGTAPLTVLIAVFAALGWLFSGVVDNPDKPPQWILLLILMLVVAGAAYLYCVNRLFRVTPSVTVLPAILLTGAVLRLLVLFSAPILEDDYHRYLWDGAVTAHGLNPYAYAPQEILDGRAGETPIPEAFRKLAEASPGTLAQINHPHVRTIYPVLTEAAFALAYWIKPWSVTAWRLVLLLFDMATLLLLLHILKYLKRPLAWISIYWLNPLLIKEIFNSGHMDVLMFPFLLGAILFSLRRRLHVAVPLLAAATAVKVWPVLLLPIVLRPVFPDYRRMAVALGGFAGLCLMLFSPILLTGLTPSSGFIAYSARWQLNDSLFSLILWVSQQFLSLIHIHPGHGQRLARLIVAGLWLAWVGYLTLQKPRSQEDVFRQCLAIVAALFLLSPTQFPWYATWMVPFLVIVPRRSLLLLTLTMPLYYLWHYFSATGQVEIFHRWIPWIEFVPVWIALLREWWRNRSASSSIGFYATQRKPLSLLRLTVKRET